MFPNQLEKFIRSTFTIHIPGKEKSIVIMSSPRSGSTWLLETLCSVQGMKPIREPMNLRKLEVPQMLGISDWKESYSNRNVKQILNYLRQFTKGNFYDYRFKREKPFSKTWHLITHRTVFKVLHGCEDMIEEIEVELNAQIIFLVRHPVPVCLSRESAPRTQAFIESDYNKNFTANELEYARTILMDGSDLQKSALDWCLQNAVPLRKWRDSWILISYEEMVEQPEHVLTYLSNKLGLRNPSEMFHMIYRASGSSRKSSKESQSVMFDDEKIKAKRHWLVSKWHETISATEESQVFEVLANFGIDIYLPGLDTLNPKYLKERS
jgi:hypothetical protein